MIIFVDGVVRVATSEEEARFMEDKRMQDEDAERAEKEYAISPAGRTEAQVYFTAVMTDTLLEE